jgi:hypothetical protein
MKSREFDKRRYDCFITYGSEDYDIAETLAEFIERAGLKVFLDTRKFSAGSTVLEGLFENMSQSKACLALLSSRSIGKNFVQEELRAAHNQTVTNPGFRFVAAILDDYDPTKHRESLALRSWFFLKDGELTTQTARNLLLALRFPESLPTVDQPQVYVSCSWRDYETHPRDQVLSKMKAKGAFLVGDSQDQRSFKEEGPARITRIMSGCSGFLMILPDRVEEGKTPEESFKYFNAELKVASKLGIVQKIYCARRDVLPASLQSTNPYELKSSLPDEALSKSIEGFLDDVGKKQPHSFLATDYKLELERNRAAKEIVESLLGMECFLGREVQGAELRKQVQGLIKNANLVVADLACKLNELGHLKININTCIEAGFAVAHEKPLFLTCLDPQAADPLVSRTSDIPFYFRDHAIEWYQDTPGFLANIYRIAFNRRRRVINDEL